MRLSFLSSGVGFSLAVGCSEGCDGWFSGFSEASPAGVVDSFFFGCSSMTSSVGGGVQPFPFDSTITSVSGGVHPATFLPISLSLICQEGHCHHPHFLRSKGQEDLPVAADNRHQSRTG